MYSDVKLLSRSEVAKALGIGKLNVSELIAEGRIGFIAIGKRIFIPYTEIQKFIATNTTRLNLKSDKPSSEDKILSSAQFFDTLIHNN